MDDKPKFVILHGEAAAAYWQAMDDEAEFEALCERLHPSPGALEVMRANFIPKRLRGGTET